MTITKNVDVISLDNNNNGNGDGNAVQTMWRRIACYRRRNNAMVHERLFAKLVRAVI
jgi:hypothetical protein